MQATESDAVTPVPLSVAASVLGLTEETAHAWAHAWLRAGLLTSTVHEPPVLLDPERLLTVLRLVRDLREAGRQQGLLDEVWRRIDDAELLERADLQESLAQMRRGEYGEPLYPRLGPTDAPG